MAVLNYTHTLTAGTPENVNHVQQNFTDARTVINALDDANFNSTSGMYTAYRTIHEAQGALGSAQGTGTYFMTSAGSVVESGGNLSSGVVVYAKYLAAADYAITGRTAKLRIRAVVDSNATASAVNFVFGLAPVAVAGGLTVIAYSAGAAVAGGNVSINAPLASTATPGTGSDFSLPADGLYALFVSTTAAPAGNSRINFRAELQQRWV